MSPGTGFGIDRRRVSCGGKMRANTRAVADSPHNGQAT